MGIIGAMSVQSLDRAFEIIEILSDKSDGMALSDMAAELSLPVSTVHRLCASLMNRGYIEKRQPGSVYKLGLRFVEIASSYLGSLELKTEASPLLAELSTRMGCTVFLATNMDEETVYIDRVNTGAVSTLRNYSIIGQRRPLSTTGLGKALLLAYSRQEFDDYIKKTPLVARTTTTIVDAEELWRELEESRRRGWTFDNGEDLPEFHCVAAPIHDYRGTIIASISTSWDQTRFATEDIEGAAVLVKETAAEISHRMGYRGQT